jgi:hypothetical protein
MQNRLITFGCSLTYGHGLPDCLEKDNSPGKHPSKYAWPQLLANQLNKECVNMSLAGSSNKRIWHRLINFEYQQSDVVVILWTSPDRLGIIKSKDDEFDIGPWMIGDLKVADFYYSEVYNKYNSKIETALYINHSNLILKQKGIIPYNMIASNSCIDCFDLYDLKTEFIPLHIINDRYTTDIAEARLTRHPGIKGHELFFKDLYNFLNTR